MEVRVESISPIRVAYIRHNGPYDTCCQTWGRLYDWAARHNFIGPGTIGVGASYDDPETTPPEQMRYDACLTCGEHFKANGEVQVQTLDGGRYATAIHRGSYKRLKDSLCDVMKKWVPRNGYSHRDAPCLEIYIDDPDKTPEEDVRTKICVPVE